MTLEPLLYIEDRGVFGSTALFGDSGVFDRHLRRRERERCDQPHIQILLPQTTIIINYLFITRTREP